MQFGTCKVVYTNPNIMSYHANFPISFGATPHMFASVLCQNNSTKELPMNVKVVPGKTDYTLRLQSTRSDFGKTDAYGVCWLAIGV